MDTSNIVKIFQDLADKLSRLQPGDLIELSELKDTVKSLSVELEKILAKDMTALLRTLGEMSDFLLKTKIEGEILDFLRQSVRLILSIIVKNPRTKEEFDEKQELSNQLTALHNEIKEFVEKKLSGQKSYTQDYFANLVDNEKMLQQLCSEINERLDSGQFTLLELEYDPDNEEKIHTVFRSFHNIKGSSSFLGLRNIEEVAHEMESLLMLVRDGQLKISKELIDVIFYGINLLRNLVAIMETDDFKIPQMISSFKEVDIFSYMDIVKKICEDHKKRKVGEILAEEGKISFSEVEEILHKQRETGKKFGQIAVEEHKIKEEDIIEALHKQKSLFKKTAYVKVSNERLNQLIDTVGELVINQSMLKQLMQNNFQYERIINQLEGITIDIKNLVLSMGMVPVADIFNKLKVVIRNTAQNLGKTVIVNLNGEDTELDRNVTESIYEPLVHMVRNSVDHGLETPENREKAGKDRIGRIHISAKHRGNEIEISVRDDGKGLDREKILEKAVESSLIPREAAGSLSNAEVYQLIFQPGFSTSKEVTEVSGRGVGMDIVKKNIEIIRGRIEIITEPGQFTEFIIKIPLTLAIIEGFVTEIGDNRYVFPFDLVEEIIVPERKNLQLLEDGQIMLYHRHHHLPMIYAGEIFKEENYNRALDKMIALIIYFDNQYYGIIVDKVVGKQETVIKNLNEALSKLPVFSGGTIFGDGTIGFVVGIDEFLKKVGKIQEGNRTKTAKKKILSTKE